MITLLVIIVICSSSSHEPTWQGKKLSTWVKDLDPHESTPAARDKAAEAILHIGTNAIPFLIGELRVRTPTASCRIIHESLFERTSVRHKRAVHAFRALGTAGKTAIPALGALLTNSSPEVVYNAALVLSEMGPEGASELRHGLTNADSQIRYSIVNLLYHMGSNANPAVTSIIECLSDPDATVASHASSALLKIGIDPAFAVPILISNLYNPNSTCRSASAWALGGFSNSAHAAIPHLMQLLNDPDENVRESAKSALVKIEPKI